MITSRLGDSAIVIALLFILSCIELFSQFPGRAGTPGSTAIEASSPLFKGWATGCTVERGFLDIADTSRGRVSHGSGSAAIGIANGSDVVSLGDGGIATLTFEIAIADGEGFDFAVFENGFADEYLELAFVEVSSDGENFVRFPAISLTQTERQIGAFDLWGEATLLHDLAGKYRIDFGTPFDVSDLPDTPLLNKQSITHVRIVDVVGSINPLYATYDTEGRIVNDPYPTAFPTGGFDLDAVGVINQATTSVADKNFSSPAKVVAFPQPLPRSYPLTLQAREPITNVQIFNVLGQLLFSGRAQDMPSFSFSQGGLYFAVATLASGSTASTAVIVE